VFGGLTRLTESGYDLLPPHTPITDDFCPGSRGLFAIPLFSFFLGGEQKIIIITIG
jgi:hypothetical protein